MESRAEPPAAGETIGERLKRLRLERGFSQRELAAPGVSYAYISRIEAGSRQPSVKALRRLAGKLGVTAEYLETGSQLGAEERRELLLSDLELAVRLGEPTDAEPQLVDLLDEAIRAADSDATVRARVALAMIAMERADWSRAAALLEAAIADEAIAPIDRYDIYASLGRAYAASGRPQAAVELYEQCLEAVAETGQDPQLEARYSAFLSYALSDMGDLARAEEVVRKALEDTKDTQDPYMRVRLYWSMARLAHTEGRASVALTNVRKAIALLQATDDTLHLARAHILAGGILLARGDADDAQFHLDKAERLLGSQVAKEDVVDLTVQRARIATLRRQGAVAAQLARRAIQLNAGASPIDDGRGFWALADALVLTGALEEADDSYRRAVEILEGLGAWRDAANACRAWSRMLRENDREGEALDVLDRAAELGLRATPAEAHAER